MDTRELIDSIIASEEDSAKKFVSTMEERISDALEVRKVELASGMMGDLEEAKFETRAQWRAETPAVILKSYTAAYKKKKKADPDKADKFYKNYIKPHLERHPELAKEEVEQIDELKKSTLASYATKAATNVRTATNLARGFEDQKYSAMKTSNDNSPWNMNRKKKDPEKYKAATDRMNAAEKLQRDFERQANNRVKGIGRAAARLAKEELKPEFANASKKHPELDRDQNHPKSLKLKAPEELRKNPKFANRKMKEEVEQVDETTGVTNYNPKSQGGTRKELLAKLAKSKSPKHAWAAQKAGATQRELLAAIKMKKEEVEQMDEGASHLRYTGTVGGQDYSMTIPRNGHLEDHMTAEKIKKHNPHLKPHHVTALVNATGEDEEHVNVEHGGKKYKVHVVNHQEPKMVYNEEVEQVDEADKLAGLDYNKGHKLMYKGGKQKIVKTAGSQQAHRAMGWKERHSVRAAMKEDLVNEADMTDRQKLMLMKDKSASQTISALAKYRKVGDINKLSPAHRTLVANYMERTGGTGGLSRSMQMMALKQK